MLTPTPPIPSDKPSTAPTGQCRALALTTPGEHHQRYQVAPVLGLTPHTVTGRKKQHGLVTLAPSSPEEVSKAKYHQAAVFEAKKISIPESRRGGSTSRQLVPVAPAPRDIANPGHSNRVIVSRSVPHVWTDTAGNPIEAPVAQLQSSCYATVYEDTVNTSTVTPAPVAYATRRSRHYRRDSSSVVAALPFRDRQLHVEVLGNEPPERLVILRDEDNFFKKCILSAYYERFIQIDATTGKGIPFHVLVKNEELQRSCFLEDEGNIRRLLLYRGFADGMVDLRILEAFDGLVAVEEVVRSVVTVSYLQEVESIGLEFAEYLSTLYEVVEAPYWTLLRQLQDRFILQEQAVVRCVVRPTIGLPTLQIEEELASLSTSFPSVRPTSRSGGSTTPSATYNNSNTAGLILALTAPLSAASTPKYVVQNKGSLTSSSSFQSQQLHHHLPSRSGSPAHSKSTIDTFIRPGFRALELDLAMSTSALECHRSLSVSMQAESKRRWGLGSVGREAFRFQSVEIKERAALHQMEVAENTSIQCYHRHSMAVHPSLPVVWASFLQLQVIEQEETKQRDYLLSKEQPHLVDYVQDRLIIDRNQVKFQEGVERRRIRTVLNKSTSQFQATKLFFDFNQSSRGLLVDHEGLLAVVNLQVEEGIRREALVQRWVHWVAQDYWGILRPTFLLSCYEAIHRRSLQDYASTFLSVSCLTARRVKLLMLQQAENSPIVRVQRMAIEEESRDRDRTMSRELVERVRILEPQHQFIGFFTKSCLSLQQQGENERAAMNWAWRETDVRQQIDQERSQAVAVWEVFRYKRPLDDLPFLIDLTQVLHVPFSELHTMYCE